MARSGFKMKYSPAKGRLDGFFSSLGKQLKRNRKDIGGEFKGVKQKDKPRTDVLTKNIKNTSQPGDEAVRPKKATVSNKPKKKVSYKDAYKNADKKKYPTLAEFTTAAKAYNAKNKK
jgi:hypothetical protein